MINDDNVEENNIMVISINDYIKNEKLEEYDKSLNYLNNSFFHKEHSNVFITRFGDYSEETINKKDIIKDSCFSKKEAKRMVEFIKRNKDKSLAIIHCTAGISRSGAVGTFIYEFFGHYDYFKFKRQNPTIQPNMHVLKLLREAMYDNIIK